VPATEHAKGTQVYLARQPIFDQQLRIYGYELLYRSSAEGGFDGTDATLATRHVLSNSLFGFGLDELLRGKLGFVNFPKELLGEDLSSVVPPQSIVIEVLETVEPDAGVAASCARLRSMGYRLALDDVRSGTPSLELAPFASIIKVDCRATTAAERRALCKAFQKPGVLMLAEKVETPEEFVQLKGEQFDLFQGYFFTRPVILSRREVPVMKLNYLQLIKEIHSPEIEFSQIEHLIKREASLCRRLLCYVNSAAFARRSYVATIRGALVLMGEDELRRWVSLAALPTLATDRPGELVECAVLRARFCELLAPLAGLASRRQELFLMGMFSLLNAMVGRPLEELLQELHLPADICEALLAHQTAPCAPALVYRIVLASENGDWDTVAALSARLAAPGESKSLAELYLEAARWCRQVFHSIQ
jgi:EAL and modified HD-GYP domain-containing signal transduction protein